MVEVLAIATPGAQWDDSVKARAYEVYSKQCNGDMVCTLRVIEAWDGPKIPEKTVYDWRSRYRWRQELDAEKQAIAPISWNLYFGGLSVAGPEVVTRLRQIVNDDAANPRDQVAAGRVLLSQIASHFAELERRNQPEQQRYDDLGSMSDEELRALAAEGRSSL